MWGDEFEYQVQDFLKRVDDHIRELNAWWAEHGPAWLRYMSLYGIVAGESHFPFPPFALSTYQLLVGENPRGDENSLLAGAEYWRKEAEARQADLQSLLNAAEEIRAAMQGPNAPTAALESLNELVQPTAGLVQTQASIALQVSQLYQQLIAAKAAFRAQVVLMLGELITYVVMAVFTLGGSLALAAVRMATRVGTIKTMMAAFRRALGHITATNFLTKVPQRLGTHLALPPVRSIPPLLTNTGRRALSNLPRIPTAVPPAIWRGISTGARALGAGAAAATRAAGRSAAAAARRTGREFSLRPSTFTPTAIAARRAATGIQRGMIEAAKRTGASRATIASLRSADVRDGIARALASRWRGQGVQLPAGLAGRLGADDLARIRTAVDDAVAGGMTVRGVLGQAAFGYGVRSALIYGTLGWGLQQAFIRHETGEFGENPLSGLASSVVGAGLGGAPLAFGTRIPEMMALGGLGGAAGYLGSTAVELLSGNIDLETLQRAGGSDNLLDAIAQGAVGAVWERFPGEAEWSGARHALDDMRYLLNGPRGLNLSGLVGEASPVRVPDLQATTPAGPPAVAQTDPPGAATDGAPSSGPRTGTPTTVTTDDGRTPTTAPQTSPPASSTPPGERAPAQSDPTPPVDAETERQAESPPEREAAPAPDVTPPSSRQEPDTPPSAAPPPDGGGEARPDTTDERRLPPPVAPPPVVRSGTETGEGGPPPPPIGTQEGSGPTADGSEDSSTQDAAGTPPPEAAPDPDGPPDHPSAAQDADPDPRQETTAPGATTERAPAAQVGPTPGGGDGGGPDRTDTATAPPADRVTVGTTRHTPPVHHAPPDPPGEVRLSDDPGPLVTAVREQATEQAATDAGKTGLDGRTTRTVTGWSDEEAADALRRIVADANGRPGDPAVWKPHGDGWLIQGRHDDVPLTLAVGADGAVTAAAVGSFTPATTSVTTGTDTPAHKALGRVLTGLHDRGRLARPDGDDPTTTVLLPDGSRVQVRWVVDGTLPEGQWTISPGAFTLTAGGWRQDSPVTLGFSSVVRDQPDEAVTDLGRQVDAALTTLARGLPGPVDPVLVSPAAGRVSAPEQSAGTIWRPLPTRVRARPFDWDHDPPPPLPPSEANDLLADALAGLQSGERVGAGTPLVAVTGDPRQGVKLAHYDDGTTIAFVVEPGLAPTDTALVTPGTWYHDGAQWRQSTPTHIRVPASLSADPAGRREEMADLVQKALEEQYAARPGGDRLHRSYDRGRLVALEHLRQAGPLPVPADAADPGPVPEVTTLPHGSGFLLSYPDVTVYAHVRASGEEPGPDDPVTLTLPELAEVDSGVWQLSPATITVPGTDVSQAEPAQVENAVRQLGRLLRGIGDLDTDAVVTLNAPTSRDLADVVAGTPPPEGQPGGFVLLTDPLADRPDQYLVRVPGDFTTNAQQILDQLADRGYTVRDLVDGWRDEGVPGVVVEAASPDGRRFSLRLLSPDGIVARQAVARAATPGDTEADLHRRLWDHSGTFVPAGLDDLRLPPPARPTAGSGADTQDAAGPHRNGRDPDTTGGSDRARSDVGDRGETAGPPAPSGRDGEDRTVGETADSAPSDGESVERASRPPAEAADGVPADTADRAVVVQVPVGHAETVSDPRLGGVALTYTMNLVGRVDGLTAVEVSEGAARLEYGTTVRTVRVTTVSDPDYLPPGHARVGPDHIEISDRLPAGTHPSMVVGPLMAKALTALRDLPATAPTTEDVAGARPDGAPSPDGVRRAGGPAPSDAPTTASNDDEPSTPAPSASTAGASTASTPAPPTVERQASDDAVTVTVGLGAVPTVSLPEEVAQAASDWLATAHDLPPGLTVSVNPTLPAGEARVAPGHIELSSHVPADTPVRLSLVPLLNRAVDQVRAVTPADAASAPDSTGKPPPVITAQEGGGFYGHGGRWDADAVRREALTAAAALATTHQPLFGARYRARYVAGEELLVLEPRLPNLPAVGFRFTAGAVPDGVVAVTGTEPDPNLASKDPQLQRIPVYRTTISATIPEADRAVTVHRAVAHEVSETLQRLAPRRRFIDRLRRRDPLDAHTMGMITELRVELAARAAAPAADRGAFDRRIGQLVARFGADQERVIRELEAGGASADEVNLVRTLADPGASWRQEVLAEKYAAAEDAVRSALDDLTAPGVKLLETASFTPAANGAGPTADVRPAEANPGDPPVRFDLTDLVDELASTDMVGERLRVTALTRLTEMLADHFGDTLGEVAKDPALAPTIVVSRRHEAAETMMRFEYQRALRLQLERLRPDQIIAVHGKLPSPVQRHAPREFAEAVLREAVPLVVDRPRLEWTDDGGLTVTGGDGKVRRLPPPAVERLRQALRDDFSDGVPLPEIRAGALSVVAAGLAPLEQASAGRVSGAFAALGRVWADPATPADLRDAVEARARELWAGEPLSQADRALLPEPARELADRVAATPPRVPAEDSLRAMRPGRYASDANDIQTKVTALASAGPEAARLAADLVAPVENLVNSLEAAEDGFTQRQKAKTKSAEKAERQAKKHEEEGQREGRRKDRWAAERSRSKFDDASKARETAARHRRIADAYRRAADAAHHAKDAYQALKTALTDLTQSSPAHASTLAARAQAAAADATKAFHAYHAAVRAAQPVELNAGVISGQLPMRNALTNTINDLLAAQGLDVRVEPDELQRMLGSKWRWVSNQEGAVATIGMGEAEVRVTYRPGDPVEVLDPGFSYSEMILGQLPQFPRGSRIHGGAWSRAYGVNVKLPLVQLLGSAIPEGVEGTWGALRALARHAIFDLTLRLTRQRSVSGWGTDAVLPGSVLDNRDESLLYSVDGRYEVSIRPRGAGTQFSPTKVVDQPAPGDTRTLQTWVMHPYTVGAPTRTVSLESLEPGRAPEPFPEHVVTDLDGLDKLYATAVQLTGGATLDDIARSQLSTIVREEYPARTWDTLNGRPLERFVSDGRGNRWAVRLETEWVPHTSNLQGSPGKVFLERLRVTNVGTGGSVTVGGAAGIAVDSGATTGQKKLLNDPELPPSEVPTVTSTLGFVKGGDRHYTLTVSNDTFRPNVNRYADYTQSYRLQLRHRITVKQLGDDNPPAKATILGGGTFRMPEAEAYRAGLPVDADAVLRDANDNPQRHSDGRVTLRGDYLDGPPPGRLAELPSFLGPQEMAGALGGVRNLTNVPALLEQFKTHLRQQGLLPDVDADGFPILHRNPAVADAQIENITALEQLSASRIEGAYDQAAQDGIPLELNDYRHGGGIRKTSFLIRVRRPQNPVVRVQHTSGEVTVFLNISSAGVGREVGVAQAVGGGGRSSVSAGKDVTDAMERAVTDWAGFAPIIPTNGGLEGSGQQTTSTSYRTSDRYSYVTLYEGTGNHAVFTLKNDITISRLDPDGGETELAKVDSSVQVVLPGDLLPEASTPAFDPPPDERLTSTHTPEHVLDAAKMMFLDVTGMAEGVRKVLPSSYAPGSTARPALNAVINTYALTANEDLWRTASYGTELAVDPTRGRQASLEIVGEVGGAEYVGRAELVHGDIGFAMVSTAVGHGRQQTLQHTHPYGEDVDLALVEGEGGQHYARTYAKGASHTFTQTSGEESLAIRKGVYLYKAPVRFRLTGEEGIPLQDTLRTRTAPWKGSTPKTAYVDGQALFSLSEQDALKFYLEGALPMSFRDVVDALYRYSTGDLELDRKVALDLVKHYQEQYAKIPADKRGDLPNFDERSRATWALARQLAKQFPELGEFKGRSSEDVVRTILADGPGLPDVPDTEKRILPAYLKHGVGQGTFEPATVRDDAGRPVKLYERILHHVGAVSPEAAVQLKREIIEQFGGKRWYGKLSTITGPTGYEFTASVRVGNYLVEDVTVRVTGSFRNAESLGDDRENTRTISQRYAYHQIDRASTRSVTKGIGGQLDAAGAPPRSGTGSDRDYTHTRSAGEQNTRIQRMNSEGAHRVGRELHLHIEVTRSAPRPTETAMVKGYEAVTRRNGKPSSNERLTADLVQLVPQDLTLEQAPAPSPPDPRSVPLPAAFSVDAVEIPGSLREVIRTRLAEKDLLGPSKMEQREVELDRQLSRLPLEAGFERIAGPGGYPRVILDIPGEPGKGVKVVIRAALSDQQEVGPERQDVEGGVVDRSQHVAGEQTVWGRVVPFTLGDPEPIEAVETGFRVAGSGSRSTSITSGDRDETTNSEKWTAVPISVRVDYHLSYFTTEMSADGTPTEKLVAQQPFAATGRAFLSVPKHHLDAMREQMARGDLDAAVSKLDSWFAERDRTAPDVDLTAVLSRALAGRSGDKPTEVYDLVTKQLDKDLGPDTWRTPPVLRVSVDPDRHPEVDAVTIARLLARERGRDVHIEVGSRQYRARPDGGLLAGPRDDGYAAARAALPPDLANGATAAGIDLRKLYFDTKGGDRTFPQVVQDALKPSWPPSDRKKVEELAMHGVDVLATMFGRSPSEVRDLVGKLVTSMKPVEASLGEGVAARLVWPSTGSDFTMYVRVGPGVWSAHIASAVIHEAAHILQGRPTNLRESDAIDREIQAHHAEWEFLQRLRQARRQLPGNLIEVANWTKGQVEDAVRWTLAFKEKYVHRLSGLPDNAPAVQHVHRGEPGGDDASTTDAAAESRVPTPRPHPLPTVPGWDRVTASDAPQTGEAPPVRATPTAPPPVDTLRPESP